MDNIYDDAVFFGAYAKMQRSKIGLAGAGEWRQLKNLFPDLKGKRVLDLGCGYGWHCKYAVECGAAEVMGIDLSEKMIAAARKKHDDPRITYQVCGLASYDYPEAAYDFVISNLALHYIEDLNEIYEKVYRTLTKDGVFLFNIEHPTFTGSVQQEWVLDEHGSILYWPVDRYFYPGERQTQFLGRKVIKFHHTLTQILNGLLQSGFEIRAVEEAMPPQDMLQVPGMEEEMRRPMMLIVKAKRN